MFYLGLLFHLIWKNYVLYRDFDLKSWIVDFLTRFTWEKTPQNNFCYVLNCGGLSWNVCWGSLAVFYCIEPWVMISWGYQHQYAPAQHPETTTIWFSKEVTDYPKKGRVIFKFDKLDTKQEKFLPFCQISVFVFIWISHSWSSSFKVQKAAGW